MSINLTCNEVELVQTPTWLTRLALYDHQHNRRDWKETKYIYTGWLKSTLNGVWDNAEQLEEARKGIQRHIEELSYYNSLHFDEI